MVSQPTSKDYKENASVEICIDREARPRPQTGFLSEKVERYMRNEGNGVR